MYFQLYIIILVKRPDTSLLGLRTDVIRQNSHIYKHLNTINIGCKEACSNDCFSILDMAPTSYQLKIKEGLNIGWKQPSLKDTVALFFICYSLHTFYISF